MHTTIRGARRARWPDLVVIERDCLAIPADEIKEITSVITMVGGRVVYDAAAPVTTPAAR